MAVARDLVHDHHNTVNKFPQWQTRVPMVLGGKTLGVLGLGNLGKMTAKVRIIYFCVIPCGVRLPAGVELIWPRVVCTSVWHECASLVASLEP